MPIRANVAIGSKATVTTSVLSGPVSLRQPDVAATRSVFNSGAEAELCSFGVCRSQLLRWSEYMDIPPLSADLRFRLLANSAKDIVFSFEVKKAAMRPHIAQKWGWG